MRYLALVMNYDGTPASHDRVSDSAADALKRLKVTGRRSIYFARIITFTVNMMELIRIRYPEDITQ